MDGQELIARQQPIDPSGNLRDLVFRIKERRHTLFRRRNADLLLDIKISLREALVGFDYCIPHLDGTDLWIRRRPGEITSFGQVLILANQGMPLADRPSKRGKLFVRVEVGKLVPHSSTLVWLRYISTLLSCPFCSLRLLSLSFVCYFRPLLVH